MQQHHAGEPAAEAIEGPQVDRVKAVGDAALADRTGDRRGLAVDGPHLRAEDNARWQLRRRTLEEILAVIGRPALDADRADILADERAVIRIVVVTPRLDLNRRLAVAGDIGADMRKAGIAA